MSKYEIKSADSKGRLMVGEGGVPYSVTRHPDGRIEMFPLRIADVPELDEGSLRAVYVTPGHGLRVPPAVTLFSTLGDASQQAKYISELANEHMVPVIVKGAAYGYGRFLSQLMSGTVNHGIVEVQP